MPRTWQWVARIDSHSRKTTRRAPEYGISFGIYNRKGDTIHDRILHEVPRKPRDRAGPASYNEEREAGHTWQVQRVRGHDVQDRLSFLTSIALPQYAPLEGRVLLCQTVGSVQDPMGRFALFCPASLSLLSINVTAKSSARMSHHGECDIESKGTRETKGTQQLAGEAHDDRAGIHTDGSEHTP